jgi:hypothetical protein
MPKKNYISKHTRNPDSNSVKVVMPYSYGKAVPRGGSLEACLCKDRLTYSRKCCEGYLINQGIGSITGYFPPDIEIEATPWSAAFQYDSFGPHTQLVPQ